MSDDPALNKLKKEIQAAKEKAHPLPHDQKKKSASSSKYFNVGAELVGGVIMGVGLGLFVDWILGTSPWGLITLFILGSTAGMLNVYRVLTNEDKKDNSKDIHG